MVNTLKIKTIAPINLILKGTVLIKFTFDAARFLIKKMKVKIPP